MTALNWIRSKARTTVEVRELGGKQYEITSIYFRGVIPANMKRQVIAEAKNLINTETVTENLLFSKQSCEYWHKTYAEVVA